MKKIKKDPLIMFYFSISIMIVLGILLIYIISLDRSKKYLENEQNIDFTKIGENKNLKLDENIKKENVIYEVMDEDIVKINDEGQLVSTGEGSTKVIVKSKDGSKLQTIVVNVGKEAIEENKKNSTATNNPNTNKNNTTMDNTNKNSTTTNNTNTNKNNTTTNNTNANKNSTATNNTNANKNSTATNNTNANKNNTTTNNTNTNKNNTTTNNTNANKNSTATNNTNTNKNNTTTNNTNTNKNNTTTNNTNNSVVRVSGVSLNMNGTKTIYLNKENSLYLNATVYPTNATNKNITWSSSNTNVATVSNGTVNALNPGKTIITVKTSDGGKIASMTLVVRKNIIIIVGASQVKVMDGAVTSWESPTSKYVYSKSAGTLRYVYQGGTGIEYQTTGDGMTGVKKLINNNKSYNSYINYFIFYPLSGNTIKNYVCNDGKIYYENNTTKTPEDFANEYIDAYNFLKTITENLKGYVVSMHPVNAKQDSYTKGLSSNVVRDVDENSCTKGFRSNIKYYRFNIRMKNGITNKVTGLYYQSLFSTIMEKKINSSNKTYFNFKNGWTDYTTVDGVHWDNKTAEKYVSAMLSYSKDL